MRQRMIDGVMVTRPTREDVLGLQVGDEAPDPFNKMRIVTRIYARGERPDGRLFVLYYTAFGERGASISGELVEDEIVPTLPVLARWRRTECVPW